MVQHVFAHLKFDFHAKDGQILPKQSKLKLSLNYYNNVEIELAIIATNIFLIFVN